jgi:hypothetical protein
MNTVVWNLILSSFVHRIKCFEESPVHIFIIRLHSYISTQIHQHILKQTPWPLVRERTIPTDRPPLVDEI